jgi:uncharacterized protein YxeA
VKDYGRRTYTSQIVISNLKIEKSFLQKSNAMAENNYIQSIIYTVREQKVMTDSDLAAIYGYETKAFNQQVKNNIQKFDDDFRFQLTKEEYHEILKSKILTLKTSKTISFSDNNEREEILRSKNLTLELQQGKYSNINNPDFGMRRL